MVPDRLRVIADSSLFLVAGAPLPTITPWVVTEATVGGTLALVVTTTAGKVLHKQSWSVSVPVSATEMGDAVALPAPVSWAMPTVSIHK